MSRTLASGLLIGIALAGAFGAGWVARGSATPAAAVDAASPAVATEADIRERFAGRLRAGDVDGALALYAGVAAAPAAATDLAALRAELIETVRERRGDAAGLDDAVRVLERFTAVYPRDGELHGVLAEGRERLGRVREALESWWRAIAHGDGAARDRARRRALSLVEVLASGARARDDAAGEIAVYREALEHDLRADRLRLPLARALAAADDHRAALAVLDGLPAGVVDPGSLASLRRRIEESLALAERFPEGLPLTKRGDHFIVEAALPDGRRLRLLLDTGATLTVLKPAVLGGASGASPVGRSIRLGTAGGVTTAPLYRLDALLLGPVTLRAVRVAALDLDGIGEIDGLLGMDQLGRFDYRIDPGAGRLHLALREDRAGD